MASQQRRNLVLGGIAVVLLCVAGYMFFSSEGAQADLPNEYLMHAVCLACQQEADLTASMSQRQPIECPRCNERAAYGWFYCPQCKLRVIPKLEADRDGGPPRIPIIPACPECGGAVGQYSPEIEPQETVGDAPLPAWPIK